MSLWGGGGKFCQFFHVDFVLNWLPSTGLNFMMNNLGFFYESAIEISCFMAKFQVWSHPIPLMEKQKMTSDTLHSLETYQYNMQVLSC